MNKKIWAIIGGGNGGQTLAGHLAMQDEQVRLFSKNKNKVKEISKKNTITLRGCIKGKGKLEFVSDDINKVLCGATNIVIVLPSTWHKITAEMIIPNLKNGQFILLLPEASCGAIAFHNYMKEMSCKAEVILGAGATLPYATRIIKDGEVNVFKVKNEVEIAALPAIDNDKLKEAFNIEQLNFRVVSSVLKTSIDNINALMHGAPTLLNVSRIEASTEQNYEYYHEGITPTICKVIEKMDQERIKIANVFGFKQRTIREEYIDMYNCGTHEDSLYQLLQNCNAYDGLLAQSSLKTRYVLEDIPYSLVPIQALGHIANVRTDVIDTIINLGKIMLGKDLDEGRTAKKLGIDNLSVNELKHLVYGI